MFLAIPYFIVAPELINAAEGETAEFRCEAGGVPKPEIKWIHNGKPISEAPPNPRRRVENNRIIIERLVESDTGNYGCNATNSLGYVYKDVYVNVLCMERQNVKWIPLIIFLQLYHRKYKKHRLIHKQSMDRMLQWFAKLSERQNRQLNGV